MIGASLVERLSGEDEILFLNLMKSRVLIDFCFYKSTKDLLTFEIKWCGNGALCSVVEDDLFFSLSFIYFDLRIYFSLVFI